MLPLASQVNKDSDFNNENVWRTIAVVRQHDAGVCTLKILQIKQPLLKRLNTPV